MPTTPATAAYVRLAHPTKYGFFFKKDHDGSEEPWVERNYTRWTISDWRGQFGKGGMVPCNDLNRLIDGEGRTWEFFGYTIPLYDDPKT